MAKRTVEELDVERKRVLVRVDFNVPLGKTGKIADDSRIRASLPTVEHLVQRKARVVLMSHLGRPGGKVDPGLRLKVVASRLGELIGQRVVYFEETIGPEVKARVNALEPGQVALLENLRFHSEEEENGTEFAEALSQLGDCYVNDAFGAVHREHASVSTKMTSRLPSATGFLLAKEIQYLGLALADPPRPFYAVLGGAKVRDKIAVIRNLLDKVDGMVIGGGMSFTFHGAREYKIGKSLFDETSKDLSGSLMQTAARRGIEMLLPPDYCIVDPSQNGGRPEVKIVDLPEPGIPDEWVGVDIGPKSRELFSRKLRKARCVLWNGPMGIFEVPEFSEGTRSLAQDISELTSEGAVTILGGGDTAAATAKFGFENFSHISTGGGASLEFLSGVDLPGIVALPDKT